MQTQWRETLPSEHKMHLAASQKGYINANRFASYGHHFVDFLKSKGLLGGGQKPLVLLDGHGSYLFNYNYMSLMKEHGIAMAMLPPTQPILFNLWMMSLLPAWEMLGTVNCRN